MPKQTTIGGGTGLRATVSSLGAALHRLQVPTAHGMSDVILRYANPADYLHDKYYLGALIGRFAGRIDSGRLTLEGVNYALNTNGDANGHCLHGGEGGFHRQIFAMASTDDACELSYISPDAEQGFPGQLHTRVRYQVDGMRLIMKISATCSAPTVVNLTQHAYFNLSGEATIDHHRVRIDADQYVPVGDNLIPLGHLAALDGTPLDLRRESRLGECFAKGGESFDTYYARRDRAPTSGSSLDAAVASVFAPASGLRLNVYTTQPGLQFYTGHYLDGAFQPRQGLSLEAQGFPDAPNQAAFASARLAPGQKYSHTTVYEFVASSDSTSD